MAAPKISAQAANLLAWAGAVAGPVVLTVGLVHLGAPLRRDYVFLYLALVAVLGVLSGLWPAVACATLSFLLVDWFFVPPVGTFTIADEQDIVNLLAFAATAGVVGLLASQRRRALLDAEALARNLQQSNSELARLNREQAAAAQAALTLARSQEQIRALQQLDSFRRELLANVSHELRTPLSTILTETTSPRDETNADETNRRLQVIEGEAHRLKALVDDMLDLALIEAGTMELHFDQVLLSDAIEASIERLQARSPERRVDWDRTGADVDVQADWDRLLQILDNLLSNADRYSPPDGAIEVAVRPAAAGLVAVRVRDHGAGVAAEVRSHLFERFVHGPPTAGGGQPAGTGLGLAIVKALVEAHAGSIELEADDGEGASFRFTLPLAAS